MEHKEIEVRFLEIDKEALIKKLFELGAEDLGEYQLEEKIIYDNDRTWNSEVKKLLRLRSYNGKTVLSYKHRTEMTAEGTEEIEFEVNDSHKAQTLLERLGFTVFRQQQKLRHTFRLKEVTVDIDTWPKVPTYVELEGPSVDALTEAATALGLDWNDVELRDPKTIIEETYGIPLKDMHWFTFERFE